MSSLTNFVVAATAAHQLDATHLGAYSLAFLTYTVALTASRGLATDPLMVRLSGSDPATWRSAVRRSTGTATVVGVTAGLIVMLVALYVPAPISGAMLALGLVLPFLLLQDAWRYAFFVDGRPKAALVNDLVWAAALVPTITVVAEMSEPSAFGFVLAWGCSAGVAALAGCWQAWCLPRPGQTRAWLVAHRDLNVRFMMEGMAGSGSGQLRASGVSYTLGLSAVGYLQVVNTLMGPFQVLLHGSGAVFIPELGVLARENLDRVRSACLVRGMALAAAALSWGLLLWILLPHGLGQLVVGDLWVEARPLVPLATVSLMGTSLMAGAGAGLHALGGARRSLRVMLACSTLVVVLSVGGAVVAGLPGTMIGTAIAAWTGVVLAWRALRNQVAEDRALRAQALPEAVS
ncbi:hypothetical protein EKO23_12485 [Nocardioides guangzhouensis]|uniref:O-antigen/teichoic acid export membrane protein n=1 Tax=Nocardioides guangzhouensis TaxID=2497878 RepID=A0A4Q4ZD65_9ACTN|nr:hypothetical protein [Nocardioides guangzhouensis]RYP85565.1 hypothetical protein EKO23_12485 [Nocardioides guangzhouensis]